MRFFYRADSNYALAQTVHYFDRLRHLGVIGIDNRKVNAADFTVSILPPPDCKNAARLSRLGALHREEWGLWILDLVCLI